MRHTFLIALSFLALATPVFIYIYVAFSNPTMTDTQVFLEIWPWYGCFLVAVGLRILADKVRFRRPE